MAFFDDLNKKFGGMAQSAQKTAEVVKLQHQINQKQAEFDSAYHQIGQLYYGYYQRGVQPDESINALCAHVTAIALQIEDMKQKIDQLRNVRRCTKCGTVLNRESKFCNHCGTKTEDEQPAEQETAPEQSAEPEEEKNVYINWPETKPAEVKPEEEDAPAEESNPEENPSENA